GPIFGHVVGGAAQIAEAPDVGVEVAYLDVVLLEGGGEVNQLPAMGEVARLVVRHQHDVRAVPGGDFGQHASDIPRERLAHRWGDALEVNLDAGVGLLESRDPYLIGFQPTGTAIPGAHADGHGSLGSVRGGMGW